MKSIKIAVLVFLLACNSSVNNTTSKNDFTFDGISIFKIGLTLQDTKTQLDSLKIKYHHVSSDNKYIYAFDLPYECCLEKEIIFLPYYSIGNLGFSDLFLIFDDQKLAVVRTEILEDSYSFNSILELKKFFITKYGNGEKLTSTYRENELFIELDKEMFINDHNGVTMLFKDSASIDSVRVWDNTAPINTRLNALRDAKSNFRERFWKIEKQLENGNSQKPMKPMGGFGTYTTNDKHALVIRGYSFEMIFPNKLSECCASIKNEKEKQDSSSKERREKEILEAL